METGTAVAPRFTPGPASLKVAWEVGKAGAATPLPCVEPSPGGSRGTLGSGPTEGRHRQIGCRDDTGFLPNLLVYLL